MRSDLVRALDQRLQDLRCVHWGRGFQLASEEDRAKCIEQVMSLVEPALEIANLHIVPKTMVVVTEPAYEWQYDRNRNQENEVREDTVFFTAMDGTTVGTTNISIGEIRQNGQLFLNGLC